MILIFYVPFKLGPSSSSFSISDSASETNARKRKMFNFLNFNLKREGALHNYE